MAHPCLPFVRDCDYIKQRKDDSSSISGPAPQSLHPAVQSLLDSTQQSSFCLFNLNKEPGKLESQACRVCREFQAYEGRSHKSSQIMIQAAGLGKY